LAIDAVSSVSPSPQLAGAKGAPAPGGAGKSGGGDAAAGAGGKKDSQGLTPEQQRQVAQLKARDAEVRAHEQAHQAAGGGLAGAAHFTYQTGPDGKRYAVGGEVSIDVSKERDPNATVRKMQRVKAAALAPSNPSAQDRAVARTADSNTVKAEAEIRDAQKSGATIQPRKIINITV
jgi:hypothetical protein